MVRAGQSTVENRITVMPEDTSKAPDVPAAPAEAGALEPAPNEIGPSYRERRAIVTSAAATRSRLSEDAVGRRVDRSDGLDRNEDPRRS